MQTMKREPVQHGTKDYPVGVYQNIRDISWEMILHTHWHSEMEFLFVEKGSALFHVESAQCVLQEGNLALFSPNTIHNAYRVNDTLCLYTSVVFDPVFIFSHDGDDAQNMVDVLMAAANGSALFFREDAHTQATLGALFRDIRSAHFGKMPGHQMYVKARLLELVYLAALHMRQASRTTRATQAPTQQHIKETLLYIHEHYSAPLTIAELARRVNFSIGYLERTFKEAVGTSPLAYLLGYRIQAAANLLRTTTKSISEVAVEVGFQDFSYFGRCFRQRMHLSPRAYRQEVLFGAHVAPTEGKLDSRDAKTKGQPL